jgi:hypothetical protein
MSVPDEGGSEYRIEYEYEFQRRSHRQFGTK